MMLPVVLLAVLCSVQSSGVAPLAPAGLAPVVTAASSQYFERTYNRLVAAPAPPPLQPVIPVAPPPPVFVAPVPNNVPVAAPPAQNVPVAPVQPNVAIAIATAHAAAPVATILLPPYPFGPPPGFGLVPSQQPVFVPEDNKEPTTPSTTTRQTEATTTEREPETTPVPSNSDNSFVQALPSNENVSFKQYGLPLPLPQRPQGWPQQQSPPQAQQRPQPQTWPQVQPNLHTKARPQKLKTSVEVVPVPLAYISPPPLTTHQPYKHIKVIKHIYGFVPESSAKIIIRPASPLRIHRGHSRLIAYKAPASSRNIRSQNLRAVSKETEPTTFSPFTRPSNKPPKV